MLSFVIPAYNEALLIADTLQAIREALADMDCAYEIVVADDGSDDDTAAIAAAHGAVVVNVCNRQISATRNAGARHAKGDYLLFVDADTLVGPALIKGAWEALQSGAVGGGCRVHLSGHLQGMYRMIVPLSVWTYNHTPWAAGCFLFCTRSAFQASGGFDESLYAAEEISFSRALGRLGRFVKLREPAISSPRKLQLYSFREQLAVIGKLLRHGPQALQNRDYCSIWYDGRRDQNNSQD